MHSLIRALAALFFGALALFGAIWTLIAMVVTRRSNRTRTWRRTRAKVLRAEVIRNVSHETGPAEIRVGYAITYEPHVTYSYSAAGREYTGNTLTLAVQPAIPDEPSASRILTKYPVGNHVDAFYNPAQPEESVLQPGGSRGNVYFVVVGVVLVVVGIIGFLVMT